MTLLTIVQGACRRLSLDVPTAVASSTDPQVRQLFELVNQEGTELARRADWSVLTREQTFTTTAAEAQTGALPSDFDRFIDGSMWNRTTRRRVLGPMSPQEWQREKSSVTESIVYDVFRVRGSDLLFTPTPPAGETIAFDYVTSHWAEDSGGTGKAAMTQDTDTSRLDDELVKLGLVWRFRQAKGLDYGEAMLTYEREVGKRIAREGGQRPALQPFGARNWTNTALQVPEGSWGL